jgi:hypothetical protein
VKAHLRHQILWITLGVVWLGGVVAGLGVLWAYDNTPGEAANAPVLWPAGSRLQPDPHGPTLVMLAHPRCSCTAASLAELAELLARTKKRPRTYVVFLKPESVSDDWSQTPLWQTASAIPGVTVVRDDDGLEATRFDAFTSGQTMLYDTHGHLIYSGGTTGSRGHAGDNPGRASILALLNHDDPQRHAAPVFGCPLFASREARRQVPASDLGSSDGSR